MRCGDKGEVGRVGWWVRRFLVIYDIRDGGGLDGGGVVAMEGSSWILDMF